MRNRRKSLKYKFKELCTKVRFWLVKKLGGCIAEYKVDRYEVIDFMDFVATESVPFDKIYSDRFVVERLVRTLVCEHIAREIVESGYYEVLWSDDGMADSRMIKVRVRVLPLYRR